MAEHWQTAAATRLEVFQAMREVWPQEKPDERAHIRA